MARELDWLSLALASRTNLVRHSVILIENTTYTTTATNMART